MQVVKKKHPVLLRKTKKKKHPRTWRELNKRMLLLLSLVLRFWEMRCSTKAVLQHVAWNVPF